MASNQRGVLRPEGLRTGLSLRSWVLKHPMASPASSHRWHISRRRSSQHKLAALLRTASRRAGPVRHRIRYRPCGPRGPVREWPAGASSSGAAARHRSRISAACRAERHSAPSLGSRAALAPEQARAYGASRLSFRLVPGGRGSARLRDVAPRAEQQPWASLATLCTPQDVLATADGGFVVTDSWNRIRRSRPRRVPRFAGTGAYCNGSGADEGKPARACRCTALPAWRSCPTAPFSSLRAAPGPGRGSSAWCALHTAGSKAQPVRRVPARSVEKQQSRPALLLVVSMKEGVGSSACRCLGSAGRVVVASGAHVSIAPLACGDRAEWEGSFRRRISKVSRQAARRKPAPAGANGWLRVSMCQIASVSLRESSIWATLGRRWRPRRRLVCW